MQRPVLTQPKLDEFREAAARGRWVWVEEEPSQVRVCAGLRRRRGGPQADVGAFFVAALREHYGLAASAVAERQLDLHKGQCEPLPSRTIDEAVQCAANAQALLDGSATALRFEYSARLLGRGFVDLCAAQGLDARRLSMARRSAIDEGMRALFEAAEQPDPAAVLQKVRALLNTGLH